MNERIKELRIALGLTQKKIGEILGITEGAVSNIEKGSRNVTVQMQKAICREFNVDYLWLTEGIGEMFIEKSKDEEIAEMLADIQLGGEDAFKHRFVSALSKLDESDWESLEKLIDLISGK